MTSLTFFGGVGEIGGNKILLEDGDTRIWLDFGQSFTRGTDFFTGWLQPRSQNGLGDYFEFNLVPRIEGLYAEHLLVNTTLPYKKPAFDAVFLSHAHFDHVNHIAFLDPSIPVYCGAGTKLFLEAAEETTGITFGEHVYRTFRTGEKIKIKDLEIEPIHVDHSIPAAYGFIVHTSEGAVVYTGDLRKHGPKQEMTEEFIKRATESEPVALICEGTRMEAESWILRLLTWFKGILYKVMRREARERRWNSEDDVLEGVKKIISQANNEDQGVFYTHNSRDMDRFRTFYTAAVAGGRRVIVMPRVAHLLTRLVEDEHLDLPDPLKDSNIAVYFRRKKSGEYQEKDYYLWERLYLGRRITAEDLRVSPTEYAMHLDFNCFTELIDIQPGERASFIYSMSEPFSEDDIEARVMYNWLNHFGLDYHQIHASGHMSKNDLIEMIKEINPQNLFPVHTKKPELFKKYFKQTILLKEGERYKL